jgi:hypothetical protein
MSIMDMIWDYFLQNNPKNLVIHYLSWFQASPKFLSQVDSGSSQFCQTLPNFLGFVPKIS